MIATALLNAVGPALLYFSGRMIVGRIPAAIASLLLAFLPFFVGEGNSLLSDSPALTLLLLGFLLLLFALRRQGFWRFASVGFVFALTALMRVAALSTIGILLLLIFFADRRCRALLASAFGFLIGFVPYLCWSRLRYGSFLETMRRGWTSHDDLKRLYASEGIDGSKLVIAYCRIGERSSHTWYVLKHLLGCRDVLNYDGSWTDWGNLVGGPVERGGVPAAKAA